MTDDQPYEVGPEGPEDDVPMIEQVSRFRWRAWVDCGATTYARTDGGPFAFTERGAERKARRLLRNLRRQDERRRTRRRVE